MGDCKEEAGQKKTRSRSVSLAAVLSVRPRMDILLASHEFPARPGAKDLPKELRRGLPQGLLLPCLLLTIYRRVTRVSLGYLHFVNYHLSLLSYGGVLFLEILHHLTGRRAISGWGAGSLDNLTMVGKPGAGLVADLEEPPVLSLQPSRDSGGRPMNWRCEAGSLVPLRATRSASVSANSIRTPFTARTAYDLEPAPPKSRSPLIIKNLPPEKKSRPAFFCHAGRLPHFYRLYSTRIRRI